MRRRTRTIIRVSLIAAVVITFALSFLRSGGEENIIQFNPYFSNGTHVELPDKLKDKELPFHQIYEPRKVSLDGYKMMLNHLPNKDKLILLWTPWNHQWETINYYSLQPDRVSFTKYKCPNTNCLVTTNRSKIRVADAVVFHLLDTKLDDLPSYRHPDQVWIVHNLEAPWLVKKKFKGMDGLFNWTMSYREESDVVVKYGLVAKKTNYSIEELDLRNKKPVVWLSSDCNTDGRREDYVKELSRHIEVDVYGKCGSKKCFPAQSSYCYERILKGYYFYLSFENSVCLDYVTEKFFNVLNYDVVPVVMGGAKYGRLAPEDSFIDALHYQEPKQLADFLKKLISNSALYEKYFKWKGWYASYLYPWSCYLCGKLHSKINRKAWHNLQHWWVNDAQCSRWISGRGFIKH